MRGGGAEGTPRDTGPQVPEPPRFPVGRHPTSHSPRADSGGQRWLTPRSDTRAPAPPATWSLKSNPGGGGGNKRYPVLPESWEKAGGASPWGSCLGQWAVS